MSIVTSVVTGGTNNHSSTVAEINGPVTDFVNDGVVGTIVLNSGSGGTGAFAVNAQATPAMYVDVTAGVAYVTATPSGQTSQTLRVYMASNSTSYAISSNSSGSTKYDWIYLKVDPTAANNPASDASDVTSIYTSRSSSATADDGSPPTYGIILAVVTVANGASSIANSAISDKRANASLQAVSTTTYFFDFVESGCVWTADSAGSTLNASMSSGVVWISGNRLTVASVSARAFTASKDTYIDLSNNGNGTAAFTYTEVTNNAASPALATGAIRIGIIVAGSSSIAASTSINQGQISRVLPIASSIPYAVTDSLGNLICPRDPNRKLLGARQITTPYSNANTTPIEVPGLHVPVIVPANRRIKVSVSSGVWYQDTSTKNVYVRLWEGSTSGTQLNEAAAYMAAGTQNEALYLEAIYIPTSTNITLIVSLHSTGGSSSRGYIGSGSNPVYLKVELE